MKFPELYLYQVEPGEWTKATPEQHAAIVAETVRQGRLDNAAQGLARMLNGQEHVTLCGEYVLSLRGPYIPGV